MNISETREKIFSMAAELREGGDSSGAADALCEADRVLRLLEKIGVKDTDDVSQILAGVIRDTAKYKMPKPAIKKGGVWCCPECNSRVHENHSHCHRCGKKLEWKSDDGGKK